MRDQQPDCKALRATAPRHNHVIQRLSPDSLLIAGPMETTRRNDSAVAADPQSAGRVMYDYYDDAVTVTDVHFRSSGIKGAFWYRIIVPTQRWL